MRKFFLQLRKIASRIKHHKVYREWARQLPEYDKDLSFSEAVKNFRDPNRLYRYMHQYFRYKCPDIVKKHRKFFSIDQRGFSEDALHAMWLILFKEYKPKVCLEIGVYRGQMLCLWKLLGEYLNISCEVHGISPFSGLEDSVSKYPQNINYYKDVLNNFDKFNLPYPKLLKNLSTDKKAINYVASKSWDMIYIDGGHEYETVLADYRLCRKHLKKGGILVIDDAALFTNFNPYPFSFKGHPGPSRVAKEKAMKEMKFLGEVGHNMIFMKK